MDEDKEKSANVEEKEERKTGSVRNSVKWLVVVGILAIIIIIGLIYILTSPRGRIPVTVESFTPKGEITRTTNFTI